MKAYGTDPSTCLIVRILFCAVGMLPFSLQTPAEVHTATLGVGPSGYSYSTIQYQSMPQARAMWFSSTTGNYYDDHDHTDTPEPGWFADGITDADYDLPGSEPDDYYPLAKRLDSYYGSIFVPYEMPFDDNLHTLVLDSLAIGNHEFWGEGLVEICAGTLFIGGR